MSKLPVPKKPYPDWSRFLVACWKHGVKKPNKELATITAVRMSAEVLQTWTEEMSDEPVIRPSRNLSCARQSWLIMQGMDPDPSDPAIRALYSTGKYVHAMTNVMVLSAMPECFLAEAEIPIKVPDWWPDHPLVNKEGTLDLRLSVRDKAEAAKYLDLEKAPHPIIGDYKSMTGNTWRQHKRKDYEDLAEADPFGTLAQLATYSEVAETLKSGALVIGVNRESPAMGIAPRHISAARLKEEYGKVNMRMDLCQLEADPGPEMIQSHENIGWYCGHGSPRSYCPMAGACKEAGR